MCIVTAKIFEYNQTIVDNKTLQLKLQCTKKEHISLLGKYNASEVKVKITHDAHWKNVGEVSKMDRSTSKQMEHLHE